MRAEDILDRLEDLPFRPFRMYLTDGTTFDVVDRFTIMVGLSTVILPKRFATDEEGRRIAAGWRKVAVAHIVQLSELDEPAEDAARPAST